MREVWKRLLAGVVAVTLAVGSMCFTPVSLNAYAAETEYEIYPKPQEITYQEGNYVIRSEVNVVYEEDIDEATENRLTEVLESKNKTITEGTAVAAGKTNVLVGVYGSGDYVDTYVQENYEVDAALFEHFGSHYVFSDNDKICILGKDTDAAFYGITSLMHIFNQMDGSTIRNFTIADYADTNIRGFIEGYYGIPWSNEDRMSLMEFGGQFKMTSYIFAPKDDIYHTSKWRELYPEEELNAIKEMVAVGNATKCRFVWTAHPFRGGFNAGAADAEITALLRKFDQLYSAGVRQFGVLGDDVGNLPRAVVIKLMQEVSKWAKAKGDVYDTVFCPAGYNDSWQGDYSELNDYDAGFPDDIQIFWTGQAVCQPIEQRTLTNFRTKNRAQGEEPRRAPLFWLNWPVNDINMSRLMMGKGSLLHTDINIDDLAGAVTNPMQDAEASKVAIFAVADYAWNVKDFDDDKSWADSFKYIEPDATEAFHTLAKHMSDPKPNNHGLVLDESEELKPLLDAFMALYEAGTFDQAKADGLIAEFEEIMQACVDFHKLSKNAKLKEELLPFTKALSDMSEAAILFLRTAAALDEGNTGAVWSNYSNATAKLASAKNYDRPLINNGTKKALPGSKWITPFVEGMNTLLAGPVNSLVDESKVITSFITSRTDITDLDAVFEKLTDGNEATEVVWQNPASTSEGTYLGLTYSRAITLNDVTFKMGRAGNIRDTFQNAKLEYKDAATGQWTAIPGSEYTDRRAVVTAEGLDLQVKGIRLISTAEQGNMWLGCKDIIVNAASQETPEEPEGPAAIEGIGIYNTDLMVVRSGNTDMMTDGVNDKSGAYAGFSRSSTNGDPDKDATVVDSWVGIEFPEVTEVGSILVSQGTGDHIVKGTLEYKNAAGEWVEIGSYEGIGENFEETFTPVNAKALRLVNKERAAIWWRIYEIQAFTPGEDTDTSPLDKNIIKTEGWTVYSGPETNLTDGDDNTGVWYDTGAANETNIGDFIGLDLGRVTNVGKVHFVVGNDGGDRWVKYRLEYSEDNTTWTTFKSYTGAASGKDVYNENLGGARARYVRLVNEEYKKAWVKFCEFSVEKYVEVATNEYVYTNVPELANLGVVLTDAEAHFEAADNLTLGAGEYLGLKLDRIKDITDITVETSAAGLTLQTSKNGVVWTDVAADAAAYEDARYIRVINRTDAAISFNLTTFAVESYEIAPISVSDKNISFYTEGDGMHAFDKNRTTEVIFNHSQRKGDFVSYDLGQTIDLNSISLVSLDSAKDFPRHAKISVSENGTDWTDVMFIGSQDAANAGEQEGTDNIMDVLPIHDVSSNLKTVTGLNERVRYIKFEVTRDKIGPDKWTRFTEIELNGGDMFLPTSNNPTIITDAAESENNEKINMIDGEVSTTFKPASQAAGTFTYYFSENTDTISKVSILQSPSNNSNATVTAEVMNNGAVETVELGTLSTSLNEFNTGAFDHVLSVKVEWTEGNVPEIHEIITSKTAVAAADKEALQTYYDANKALDTTSWTEESKAAYTGALAKAAAALENAYATQVMVDEALAELTDAVVNKVELGDFAAFAAAVAELTKDVLAEENYLQRTWTVYAGRLANAEAAITAGKASQAELDALLAKLTEAKNGLVYEVNSIEQLKLAVQEAGELTQTDYAADSWTALPGALTAAQAVIAAEAEGRQLPSVVKEALTALQTAMNNLVDLRELKAEIAKADAKDTSIYTEETVTAFTQALNDAKAVIDNPAATKTDVSARLAALKEADENLVVKGDVASVRGKITELKALAAADYTTDSYAGLTAAIAAVEAALTDNSTEADCNGFVQQLTAAEDALVNIAALRAAVAETERYAEADYTPDSYAALTAAVEAAEALYTSGTEEEVAAAEAAIEEAVAGLKGYIAEDAINEALAPYEEMLEGNYTKATEDALKAAIDAAKALGKMTDEQLTEIVGQLEQLAEQMVSTEGLLEAIAEAEKADKDLYTKESFDQYQAVIDDAKKLLENGTADEIEAAVKALGTAKAALVAKATAEDLAALKAAYDKYANYDWSKYTDASAQALKAELNVAKFMLDYTGDQGKEQVELQIKNIEAAAALLAEKPPVTPDTKPDTPDQGNNGGNSSNGSNSGSKPQTAPGAATGDSTNAFVWVFVMTAALAVLFYERKKRA